MNLRFTRAQPCLLGVSVTNDDANKMGIFQSKHHIHNYKLLKSGDRYPISKKVMEFIDLVSPSYICQDKDCRLPMYKCRLCERTGILEYEAKYGLTAADFLNHMMSGACVVQISTEDSNEFKTNPHLPHCVLIDKNLGCKCCDMVFDVFPDFLAYKNHIYEYHPLGPLIVNGETGTIPLITM